MGRNKSKASEGLPTHVIRERGNYVYRPYLGGGKFGHRVKLCPLSAPTSAVWAAYERVTKSGKGTLQWMLNEFTESREFQRLKPRTRSDYLQYKRQLCETQGKRGKFGEAKLRQITPRTIQGYLDAYAHPVAANRQISFMQSAWNWCRRRYDIPENPCTGVRNDESARDRYVTQEEFEAFKAIATSEYVPLFMELAYLCRARWGEVSDMRHSDILEEGLLVRRLKGSKSEITAWTPRLIAAVDACKALNATAPAPISGSYLIHTSRGGKVSYSTWKNAWRRAMLKWDGESFTFHDLKASGYSDMSNPEAGHRSARMHDVYMRKAQLVEPPK